MRTFVTLAIVILTVNAPAWAEEQFPNVQTVDECRQIPADLFEKDLLSSQRGICFSELWARTNNPKDCDVVVEDPDAYRFCVSYMAMELNDHALCQSVADCEKCKDPTPPACATHFLEEDWKQFEYEPIENEVENNPGVAANCRQYALKENQEKCFWGLSRRYISSRGDEMAAKRMKACLEKPSNELFELCVRDGAETFLLDDNRLAKAFKDVLRANPARTKMFCKALESKKFYPKEIRQEKFFAASAKEFCPKVQLQDGAPAEQDLWPEEASAMLLISAMAPPRDEMGQVSINILEGGSLAAEPSKGTQNLIRFHNRGGKMVAEYGIDTQGMMGETLMLMLMVPVPKGARDFEITLPERPVKKTWIGSTILKQIINKLPSTAFNDPTAGVKERLLAQADQLRDLEEHLAEDKQIEEHIGQMKAEAVVNLKPEYYLATPDDAPPSLPVEAMLMEKTFDILQHHYMEAQETAKDDCENMWGVRKEANDNYRSRRDICRGEQAGKTGGRSCEKITDPISQARCMAQAAYDTDDATLCDKLEDNGIVSPPPAETCQNELRHMQAPAKKSDYVGQRRKALKGIEAIVFSDTAAVSTKGITSGD